MFLSIFRSKEAQLVFQRTLNLTWKQKRNKKHCGLPTLGREMFLSFFKDT